MKQYTKQYKILRTWCNSSKNLDTIEKLLSNGWEIERTITMQIDNVATTDYILFKEEYQWLEMA